jgi:hypothetical protein
VNPRQQIAWTAPLLGRPAGFRPEIALQRDRLIKVNEEPPAGTRSGMARRNFLLHSRTFRLQRTAVLDILILFGFS